MKRDLKPSSLGGTVRLVEIQKQLEVWNVVFPHLPTASITIPSWVQQAKKSTLVVPKPQALCRAQLGSLGPVVKLYEALERMKYVQRTITGNLFLEGYLRVTFQPDYLCAMEKVAQEQVGDFLFLTVVAGDIVEGAVLEALPLSTYEVLAAVLVSGGKIPVISNDKLFLRGIAPSADEVSSPLSSCYRKSHAVVVFDSRNRACILEVDEAISIDKYAKRLFARIP